MSCRRQRPKNSTHVEAYTAWDTEEEWSIPDQKLSLSSACITETKETFSFDSYSMTMEGSYKQGGCTLSITDGDTKV